MTEAAYLREGRKAGRLLPPRSVFRAIAFNHLSYGVADYAATREWYMDIFGMDCLYDDGRQASVGFGRPRREIYIRKRDEMPVPCWDHWAFSIADFDAEQAHQALVKWGIAGIEKGGECSWRARDDNGFVIQVCAESGIHPGAVGRNAGEPMPSGGRPARSSKTGWKATAINHVSYGVPDYRRTRDFYIDLFGMRIAFEDGLKCALNFGADPEDSLYIVQRADGPVIDHIAVSIAGFDLDQTEQTIRRLGLAYSADGDSAWTLTDPNGRVVQVCAETGVYPGAAYDFFHQTRMKK
jgi:catechol 2,3-dioxygenase-like lactoylglutathione lyase family enzyme